MSALDKVRTICLALPGAAEVEAWGHPTFRVKNKIFCGAGEEDGKVSVTFKVDPALRDFLVGEKDFFVPAYVGSKGWLGLRVGAKTDWKKVRDLVAQSHAFIAGAKKRQR